MGRARVSVMQQMVANTNFPDGYKIIVLLIKTVTPTVINISPTSILKIWF